MDNKNFILIIGLAILFSIIITSFLAILVENRIYGVLFLICSYIGLTFLCFLLKFEFVAVILLLVYVGAIAVFFLFIVMMLGTRVVIKVDLATGLVNLILVTFIYIILLVTLLRYKIFIENFNITDSLDKFSSNFSQGSNSCKSFSDLNKSIFYKVKKLEGLNENIFLLANNNIMEVGFLLYTWFVVAFIGSGLILLVAIIGVVTIIKLTKKRQKSREEIVSQLQRVFLRENKNDG